MFENVCTLPLTGAIVSQALHPTEPIVTVGLYNGRVQSFRLPATGRPSVDDMAKGTIETLWETRRHKQGCRALGYTPDGNAMFSAGADGFVKHFESRTGRVISKLNIPTYHNAPDHPSILHALDANHLLLGCDSGALHVFDVRANGLASRPARTTNPHGDCVSSINPVQAFEDEYLLKPASGPPRQFVTTGGSTIAVSDIRTDKVVESEDQEDDLLCATYVPGLGLKGAVHGALAVGCSTGVVTLWDRGSWDDQQDRVVIDKDESIDALVRVPAELGYGGRHGKAVFAATGDGRLTMIDTMKGRIIDGASLRHDDTEGVVAGGFDCYNRLITGGGMIVKVWEDLSELQGSGDEEEDEDEEEEDEEDDDSEAGEDEESEEDEEEAKKGTKRSRDESSDDSDSDSEDEREREKRERQRIKKEATAARLGPMGAHGILKFEGLD
ncbi:related to WD repeat-containing protein jip5 [Cephalotrichum gorgonifer]|uniref:WD repeat-containing protein JIP5 n=1 Tax=Cephalotrichum gorgonifer TaxID=2041049 RepID=A0AAE8N7F8_9PEZI|nr:related to WD repeat-containing protein jip5 [Cephalotrichum gorgonifer]